MELKSRNQIVDILRGMGIILMIMGHIGIGYDPYDDYFSHWYHAFHMPLFYIVSGFFFDNSKGNQIVFQRAKRLLIPYFFWGLFHILYSYMQTGSRELLRNSVIQIFVNPTRGGIPIAGALWFLPALFWINVIYYLLNRVFHNVIMVFVASMIISTCGVIAATHGIFLPLALDSAVVGVAFVGTGDVLRKVRNGKFGTLLFRMKWYLFWPVLMCTNILIFVNSEVNFRSGTYGIYPITYINAVLGTLLLWNVVRFLNDKCSGVKGIKCVNEMVAFIGKNTLIYVCLNQWLIQCIQPRYTSFKPEWVIWQMLARVLTLVTVCFVCYAIDKVFSEHSRLKIFLGK